MICRESCISPAFSFSWDWFYLILLVMDQYQWRYLFRKSEYQLNLRRFKLNSGHWHYALFVIKEECNALQLLTIEFLKVFWLMNWPNLLSLLSKSYLEKEYMYWNVMGWLNRLKFIGKTNRLTKMLFWPVSCVSLISLIEIWSFCTKLLENYPFV